jgi:hypothetical protein
MNSAYMDIAVSNLIYLKQRQGGVTHSLFYKQFKTLILIHAEIYLESVT